MHGPYPNSRTGAGMLKAAGLPELVAKDLENYREIAENLVTSPETLARLRKRLSEDKKSAPLFDSNYFVPRLERILTKMWQASTSGTPPVTIRLED